MWRAISLQDKRLYADDADCADDADYSSAVTSPRTRAGADCFGDVPRDAPLEDGSFPKPLNKKKEADSVNGALPALGAISVLCAISVISVQPFFLSTELGVRRG